MKFVVFFLAFLLVTSQSVAKTAKKNKATANRTTASDAVDQTDEKTDQARNPDRIKMTADEKEEQEFMRAKQLREDKEDKRIDEMMLVPTPGAAAAAEGTQD